MVQGSIHRGKDFCVIAPLWFLRLACEDIRVPVVQDLGDVARVGP